MRPYVGVTTLALGACTIGDSDVNWHDSLIYRGMVVDANSSMTLVEFCTLTTTAKDAAIVFSAPPGSTVVETVIYEKVSEKFNGGVPPDRDAQFWCSDAPQVSTYPNEGYWSCLHVADSDPVASIVDVSPKGQVYGNGASTGYSLTLRINHSGILHLTFDGQCLSDTSGFLSDAGRDAWGELTVR